MNVLRVIYNTRVSFQPIDYQRYINTTFQLLFFSIYIDLHYKDIVFHVMVMEGNLKNSN